MNEQIQTTPIETIETPSDTPVPADTQYRVFVRWGESSGWLGTERYVVHRTNATLFPSKRDAEDAFRKFKKARLAENSAVKVEHTIEPVDG